MPEKKRAFKGIDGITGSGKSYAVKMYKRQNPVGTYVVTCAGDFNAKDFAIELAEAVGVPAVGNRATIRKAVVRKLQAEQSPLLVFDEAENLKKDKPAIWETIKALVNDDALAGRCGIVLVGANNFEQFLSDRADKMVGCFPQIYRRFRAGFKQLFRLDKAEVERVCEEVGIGSKKVAAFMFDNCRNMGELRDAITQVLRASIKLNELVTVEFCRTVLNR